MTRCTQILVALRNADPTALTAYSCLCRYLGFGEVLIDLRRRVLWELFSPDGEDPGEALAALRRGGEMWNPNKEAAFIRQAGNPETTLGEPAPGDARWEGYLAWDPDRDLDRRPLALRPYRRLGWRLRRGTLWSFAWKEEDPAGRIALSERAILCSGPKEGLLVHPHLEAYRRIIAGQSVPWLPDPGREAG